MSKFKVGDKVIIKDDCPWFPGKKGTIRDDDGGKYLNFTIITDEGGLVYLDERYIVPQKQVKSDECIVIFRKDKEVIALDKTSGKKAVAKCSPEDTFDFKVGAKLAFERLMVVTLKIVKQDKYKVGDKVKIVDKFLPDSGVNSSGLMDKYLGTIMTIKADRGYCYEMVEDAHDNFGHGWAWGETEFEGKVVEESEPKKVEEPVEPFPDGCVIELTECENEIPKGTRGRVVGKCNRPGLRDCYSVDFGFEYKTTHDCDVLPGRTGRWLLPKQMQRVK